MTTTTKHETPIADAYVRARQAAAVLTPADDESLVWLDSRNAG